MKKTIPDSISQELALQSDTADEQDDIQDELEISVLEEKDIEDARNEILRRCAQSKISAELKEDLDDLFDESKYILIQFPNGKNQRLARFRSPASIKNLLSIEFEKYVFLESYTGICSYKDGFIEASVRSLIPVGMSIVYRRLFSVESYDVVKGKSTIKEIKIKSGNDSAVNISFGTASKDFIYLNRLVSNRGIQLTVRVEGLQISTHDQAVSILESLTNSLFFEIDLVHGVPLVLEKERLRPTIFRRISKDVPPPELIFPKHEYDGAPISLYWYARSARGMPLLQYLAFYQVLEFYFPAFSQREAGRRLQSVLKDPTFRPDRESDIGKLLHTIRITKGGGFGDERSQLRATIQECIDPQSLRDFFCLFEERKDYFGQKQKGLTNLKIPIANQTSDLRAETADLVYDIRCKIVHTKNDGRDDEIELLLPFSKEADSLQHYIDLVQFLAQKVLISASMPLKV